MLTKRVNGVANGPRLKQALAGVVGTLWLRPLMALGYGAINLLLAR